MDKRESREEFPIDQPFLHTVPGSSWLLEHHFASQNHSCVEWHQARRQIPPCCQCKQHCLRRMMAVVQTCYQNCVDAVRAELQEIEKNNGK